MRKMVYGLMPEIKGGFTMFTLKRENVVKIVDEVSKRDALIAKGFKLVEDKPAEPKAIDKMNKKDLLALAAEKGIIIPEKTTNEEIRNLILESENDGDGENGNDNNTDSE